MALNDASKAPKSKRKRQWNKDIIDEIRYFRQTDPNLGKDKLYPLIKDVCNQHNMVDPSASSMGRMIKDDEDKMHVFALKMNHFGKRIKINRKQVTRKPKDFKAEYPGHCVAPDTIEKRLKGSKRYILTFVDSIH